MTKYYIAIDNQRQGPFPAEELPQHGLTPESLVWCKGMVGWEKAKNVPELAYLLVQTPNVAPPQPPVQPAAYQPPYPQQYGQYPQYPQQQYGQPQYGQQYGSYQQYSGGYNQPMMPQPQLGFGEAIKICFNKYADFSGRARRSEFWWFSLFSVLLTIFTCGIGALVIIIPSIAVTVRRLHDIGRSGWWYGGQFLLSGAVNLISLFINDNGDMGIGVAMIILPLSLASLALSITLLVFYCTDSTPGENEYGISPKYDPNYYNR